MQIVLTISLLRVSEANKVDDIQTALRLFEKNRKKLKYICMTIIALAESFKTMNRSSRPDPIRLGRS